MSSRKGTVIWVCTVVILVVLTPSQVSVSEPQLLRTAPSFR